MLHTGLCVIMSLYTGELPRFFSQKSCHYVASARSKYRVHLEQERRKQETEAQGQKRKPTENDLEELKKKRKTIQEVIKVWPETLTDLLRARLALGFPSS